MRGTRAKEIRRAAAIVAAERAALDACRPWHARFGIWWRRFWWGDSQRLQHGGNRWCAKFLKAWYMREGRFG